MLSVDVCDCRELWLSSTLINDMRRRPLQPVLCDRLPTKCTFLYRSHTHRLTYTSCLHLVTCHDLIDCFTKQEHAWPDGRCHIRPSWIIKFTYLVRVLLKFVVVHWQNAPPFMQLVQDAQLSLTTSAILQVSGVSSATVWASDFWSRGRGFDCRPRRNQGT